MAMDMGYTEFTNWICKKEGEKKFAVSNSWGVRDAFQRIRKLKWLNIGKPVSEHDFYMIIRRINELLTEEIYKGNKVFFPERMGSLELRKHERGAKIEDGKLKVTYPIDWDSTLKLWYSDTEARKKKILIRYQEKEVFRVKYSKYNANYNNLWFYQFALNRDIKKELKRRIKAGETEAFFNS